MIREESGLQAVIEAGGSVLRAIRRLAWPGDAAVVVSVVHVGKRLPARSPVLDDRQVRRISAYLVEGDLDASPARLTANEGKAFIGCFLLGMGFTFDDTAVARGKPASTVAEMHQLIATNPRNAERIFPYLGGEEVNTDPCQAHRRWCIDFNDFPLRRVAANQSWMLMDERERAICRRTGLVPPDYPDPVAADWPELLEIVEQAVKPERNPQKRDALRQRWWQYADKRPGLRAAIASADAVVVISLVTPHLVFGIVSADQVFAHRLAVFTGDPITNLATLQSRIHEIWTRSFTSTFEDRLNYSPSDCVETFPVPAALGEDEATLVATRAYHDHRAALMKRHGEGLTRTYNRFHDLSEQAPEILHLRELHNAMDKAVLRAYGWPDLSATAAPEFLNEDTDPDHRYHGRLFWPAPFRDEVLARLLKLNAERAADERARGLFPGRASDTVLDEEGVAA